MELSDLAVMQEICESGYRDSLDEVQAAAWMANRLLAEIAGQLAKHNYWLEQIATHPGLEALGDIANLLKGFKATGFPVENVS